MVTARRDRNDQGRHEMAGSKGVAQRRLSATTKVQIIDEVKKEMSTEDISEHKAIDIVRTR